MKRRRRRRRRRLEPKWYDGHERIVVALSLLT